LVESPNVAEHLISIVLVADVVVTLLVVAVSNAAAVGENRLEVDLGGNLVVFPLDSSRSEAEGL
jgi:hypothetical protein